MSPPEDLQLRRGAGRQGIARVRRAQLARLAWEAVAQSAVLAEIDLALLFSVNTGLD